MNPVKLFLNGVKRQGTKITILRAVRLVLCKFTVLTRSSYFIRKKYPGYAVRVINGSKMMLDLKNDPGISRDLYIYSKREVDTTNYMLSDHLLQLGDVVLDIGSNIGYYSLLESRLVGQNGTVYSLEPVEKNFNILQKNVELNRIANISCYKLAAGDKISRTSINVSMKGNWSSIGHINEAKWFEKIEEVPMVTVDKFLQGKRLPQLIRMDIEGYEYFVLKGMLSTLDSKPKLMIEIHPRFLTDKQLSEMFAILKEKNYDKVYVIDDTPERFLNSKAQIPWAVRKLTRIIGDWQESSGKPQLMDLYSCLDFVMRKKALIHAIFLCSSKEKNSRGRA
ncbi:MAG TPA: FkbM family methyltransferase [Thermodesulfobacteriota bacterium]|nr:FkbM family methyltransferase [Thermodesulfobacteriota bacterium]